jgi:hypothetical protein
MSKSKKRGGAKAHRKRVEKRNNQISAERSAMQKFMDESIRRQIEEMKKKYEAESGATENNQ